MPTSGNEASAGMNAMMERMLLLFGLAVLRDFRDNYTWWTNFIANIVQLIWTSFVQAGDMSIEVIVSRLEEIINSLLSGGVSARETLMDVFWTICGIFEGALHSTTKLLRLSELFGMMRGPVQLPSEEFTQDDTSMASEASSEASVASEATSKASSEDSNEAFRAVSEALAEAISEAYSKASSEAASEAASDAPEAASYASSKASSEASSEKETKAEEEEKAKVKAEEKAKSESEAKTEDDVDKTTDYPATD